MATWLAVDIKRIAARLAGMKTKSEADLVAELREKTDAEIGDLLEEHAIISVRRETFAYLVLFEARRRLRGEGRK